MPNPETVNPKIFCASDFVTFSDGDVAHVIAEAGDLQVLRFVPAQCRACPCGYLCDGLSVLPEADDYFSWKAEAGCDEAELAVAVCGLVQVHEIHVDRAVRELPVELRVEMAGKVL